MERNLGNEVLIALGGLGIIICGLLFALFLSNNTEAPLPTSIPSSLVSVTAVAQSNTDDIATETSTVETSSMTPTTTATTVFEPTETATITATYTPEPTQTEPATETSVPSATDKPSPTTTDTPSPTATDTSMPTATDTLTPKPTVTNTRTPNPTATLTATSSPTLTPSLTPTATTTATVTEPTGFTGIIPTLPPSPTVVPNNQPTRTPASCRLPQGWTRYRVRPGDTLFAIALATNSSLDDLRFANCIEDIDSITAGDRIYVPRAPQRPVSTIAPSGIRGGLAPVGCSSPTTQITNLATGQRLSGSFAIMGTATRPDFQYYKIEVRPDFASIYNFYSDSRTQVIDGVLGQMNADIFGSGLHWIRLSVVDIRASIASDAICEIPVIFE